MKQNTTDIAVQWALERAVARRDASFSYRKSWKKRWARELMRSAALEWRRLKRDG